MKKVVPQDAVLIPDGARLVHKGIIFDTFQWEQELFDGSIATFEMLRRPETLIAIGIVDDKIIVLEENQPHVGDRLGFPGGRLDEEDSSPLSACRREMKEETGYEFNNWRLINVRQPHFKIEWFIHAYLATDVKKISDVNHDAGEKIKIKFLSFPEIKKLIDKKVGLLGKEGQEIFEELNSIDDLLKFPEFKGKEVDR